MNRNRWGISVVIFATLTTPLAAQTLEWVARYNGPGEANSGNGDYPRAMLIDSLDNVYLTGMSQGIDSDLDFVTIKFNTQGTQAWEARYNGPAGDGDVANAICLALDAAGGVFVTGYSPDAASRPDFFTIRYSATGSVLWSARFNGPADGFDRPMDLAADASGNLYVTGNGDSSQGQGGDYLTVKYDASGSQQWVARYDGPATVNSRDTSGVVVLESTGNIYVSGASVGEGTSDDFATVKYTSTGTQLWAARYDGPEHAVDYVLSRCLAAGPLGNAYVAGYSQGGSTGLDFATIKYDSSGSQQWVARHSQGSAQSDDLVFELALDEDENVHVAGVSGAEAQLSLDYLVVKYNSTGTVQWTASYDGPAHGEDYLRGIAIDPSGSVYVTGNSDLTSTRKAFTTIKYDIAGTQQWSANYETSSGSVVRPIQIALDASRNIFVVGEVILGSATSSDIVVLKYSQPNTWDCNSNSVDDTVEIREGTSSDCNSNRVPDECEVPDCPGACCIGNGNCLSLTPRDCSLIPGTYWAGPWTSCVAVGGIPKCPIGACCSPEGVCTDGLIESECAAERGMHQGPNTTCAGTNCPQPQGACCFSTGTCAELLAADCNAFPGSIWAGPLTTCVEVNGLPVCPLGACCLPDGSCVEQLLGAECAEIGGQLQLGKTSCAAADCPQPLGACCLNNGNCLQATEADCAQFAGSTWAGASTACVDVDGQPRCPLGACCGLDGACADALLESECLAEGGTYRGPASACAQLSCPQPIGACCLSTGNCTPLRRADCELAPNSRWAGPQTTCADDNANGLADACENIPGDINGDGQANPADISPFTAVLLGSPQSPDHVGRSDLNGDGRPDGADIGMFVDALLP